MIVNDCIQRYAAWFSKQTNKSKQIKLRVQLALYIWMYQIVSNKSEKKETEWYVNELPN